MKKLLTLICLVLFLSAGTAVAQKQLYFGLQGTGLSTWVTNAQNYGRPDMDYVATFGGGGNVTIGYDFSKNIGLQLQFGYEKLGQKFKDTQVKNDTTYQYTRNIKLNYLQLPLLFKYRTNGEAARFYVMVGPQFNFLLSANQTYYKNDVKIEDQYQNPITSEWVKLGEEDITTYYTSYDIFARLDFGADITVAKNLFITTGISLAYGLTDINATDWRNKNSSGDYNPSHNIAIGFNVGINYCLDFSKGK
jgi:opacity protein-like surface antigen